MVLPLIPLRLKKGCEAAVRGGVPWIYAGDLIDSSEPLLAPPGSLVSIETHKGQRVGTGYFNSKSPIACRVLTLSAEKIDTAFFKSRIEKALAKREAIIGVPYYRLAHAEADYLPGLLMDRFGDLLAVQVGTAGMELLQPLWMAALEEVLKPAAIVLRNDTGARKIEGLKQEVSVIKGSVPELVEVLENRFSYRADILRGQKTGWFYDQRDNRKMIADMSAGKTLLDVFSHSGGFALLAAKAGAEVTLVDSSALALTLAKKAAEVNGVADKCGWIQRDAFEAMQKLADEGKRYDIVLVDPPAFVKSKKDLEAGMKGYEKMSRMAAGLVTPGGLMFAASCSHHATRSRFNQAVLSGVKKAGMTATIMKQTGAAPDHPAHPHLPQSEYLKGLLLKVDSH